MAPKNNAKGAAKGKGKDAGDDKGKGKGAVKGAQTIQVRHILVCFTGGLEPPSSAWTRFSAVSGQASNADLVRETREEGRGAGEAAQWDQVR
jgi:hypothetical protein